MPISFDHKIRRLAAAINLRGARPPGALRLHWIEREVAHAVQARYQERTAPLLIPLMHREPTARNEFGELCVQALEEMRETVLSRALDCDWITGAIARLDRRWSAPNATEILDDPDVEEKRRVQILDDLDHVNDLVGNYAHFYRALTGLFNNNGTTRVLDLAAGHGGFALYAAKMAKQDGFDVEITATDLKEEYLRLGRDQAREQGLSVQFEVQDALNLSARLGQAYDLVLCTQSLHHFPTALIPIMYEEACQIAKKAVLFIDGNRGLAHAVPVVSLGLLRFRNLPFTHDALVSFRRFFTPQELWLLTALGNFPTNTISLWGPPSHIYLSHRLDDS